LTFVKKVIIIKLKLKLDIWEEIGYYKGREIPLIVGRKNSTLMISCLPLRGFFK